MCSSSGLGFVMGKTRGSGRLPVGAWVADLGAASPSGGDHPHERAGGDPGLVVAALLAPFLGGGGPLVGVRGVAGPRGAIALGEGLDLAPRVDPEQADEA